MVAKNTIPKWLIAEDVACERQFILHTEFPRFVAEIFDDEETGGNIIGFPKGEVVWLDTPPAPDRLPDAADKDDLVRCLARLMREAGDALNEYDRINDQKAKEADDDGY